jgi:putative NIF3 family GTP cyclohydrolase 1 type 2
MNAQQVVDAIIACSGVPKLEITCDTYLSGTPDVEVTGIVTTFMATVEVIKEAISLDANLIITHEPTYFTGRDSTDWLTDDPVYHAKKKLLDENGIVIWRYHDHMHMKKPDGIYEGLLKELDWESYVPEELSSIRADGLSAEGEAFAASFGDYYIIPKTTLKELADYFMTRLAMKHIRILGDPEMECSRIGILVGGGSLGLGAEEMPMQVMRLKDLEVIVCGEITEWTLPSYVNDAQALGFRKALLIVGHERTEEWGMKYMAQWLKPHVSGLPVTFVDAKEPFTYL